MLLIQQSLSWQRKDKAQQVISGPAIKKILPQTTLKVIMTVEQFECSTAQSTKLVTHLPTKKRMGGTQLNARWDPSQCESYRADVPQGSQWERGTHSNIQ